MKKREWNRLFDIRRRSVRLAAEFGQRAADVYLDHASKHPGTGAYGPFRIHTLCLPTDYRKLSEKVLYRLYQLNRLLHLPFGNIGWTCQLCGLYSAEYRFFDIDHIAPRCKGGRGHRSNLQVLCPNCHRRKTCDDVYSAADCGLELRQTIHPHLGPGNPIGIAASCDMPRNRPDALIATGSPKPFGPSAPGG